MSINNINWEGFFPAMLDDIVILSVFIISIILFSVFLDRVVKKAIDNGGLKSSDMKIFLVWKNRIAMILIVISAVIFGLQSARLIFSNQSHVTHPNVDNYSVELKSDYENEVGRKNF